MYSRSVYLFIVGILQFFLKPETSSKNIYERKIYFFLFFSTRTSKTDRMIDIFYAGIYREIESGLARFWRDNIWARDVSHLLLCMRERIRLKFHSRMSRERSFSFQRQELKNSRPKRFTPFLIQRKTPHAREGGEIEFRRRIFFFLSEKKQKRLEGKRKKNFVF